VSDEVKKRTEEIKDKQELYLKVRIRKTKLFVFAEPIMEQNHLKKGDKILIQTENGLESGILECFEVFSNIKLDKDEKIHKFVRKCSYSDLGIIKNNERKINDIINSCQKIIDKYKIEMKITTVEQTFNREKIFIYYTAEKRIDFRELLKDLTQILKSKIQMVQIGVRDETKIKGNLGQCGCVVCCKRFIKSFNPVVIDMAKEQGLSLNPTKISGICGRLICCLGFEDNFYKNIINKMPDIEESVYTKDGEGKVKSRNFLKEEVEVLFEDGSVKTFSLEKIKLKNKKDSDIKLDKEKNNSCNCSCKDKN
jgi:cell fate regulator YaaT (PSP1 superfamily)